MSRTIVEIAAGHARERGDALAFAMLGDGRDISACVTYAELDDRATSVARHLHEHARPGERAVLVYETGIDFVTAFLGCLYAGVVAVPVPAPEASRKNSRARLSAVLRNCDARIVMGNQRTKEMLRDSLLFSTNETVDAAVRWVDSTLGAGGTSPLTTDGDDGSRPTADDLAYLQYTSGSTSSPKGVMIGHRNIVDHCAGMQAGLDYNASSVSVCWMPHFHDYGLIEGILLPLFNGTPSYLMSPFTFLKRPASWLEAISKYRGTHTQAFNFAYRYCSKRVSAEQRQSLDLRSLRSAGNGGEPIHPDTSQEFARAFAECGLRPEAVAPVFGLAEATLLVTAVPPTERPIVLECDAAELGQGRLVVSDGSAENTQRIVACGRALPETDIQIVDPESGTVMPPGCVGEVWVSAPGVAQGYWGLEAESEETLHASIVGGASGRRYLRTGDLGVMHDDQLYITARRKDLIIIHGMNHHPQDIEWTVQQVSPLLRADNGAAFGVPVDGEEKLCVVQEIERGQDDESELTRLVGSIVDAVGRDHGVAVHGIALIQRGSIPKTTSGKIQRSAARAGYVDGTLKAVATWSASGGVPSGRP